MEISAKSRLLVVLGDPVAHSLSPLMFNAACRALGLDAVYVALRVPPAALAPLLESFAAAGVAGNVTIPHKTAVERSLARKTDACARAGACNTFWSEAGALMGDNSDVAGVQAALAELGVARGARWLVIGTGGSARACVLAAADSGSMLLVKSREPSRAAAFAAWAESVGATAEVAPEPARADVVINTTPLGLRASDALPIDPAALDGARAALDLVYAPGATRWVQALRARGVAARDGRGMLVGQGAAAFARFFPGVDPPVEVMRAAVERALRA